MPPPRREAASCLIVTRKEELFLVLGRPGSDLLSQGLSHSTIGAEEFNGRVRDGIGLRLFAKATRPAKDKKKRSKLCRALCARANSRWRVANEGFHSPITTHYSHVSMDTENE